MEWESGSSRDGAAAAAPRQRPIDTLDAEWRFVRLQLIDHINASHTWADIKAAADALFRASLIVQPMREETMNHETAAREV